MANVTLETKVVQAAPLDYLIPGAQLIEIISARCSFDGSGAAGSYVPTLRIIAPDGQELDACPTDVTLAAGASADVSWFPRVASTPAATPSGGVDPAQPYTDCLVDTTLGGLDTLSATTGELDNVPHGRASGVAWLQGGLDGAKLAQITGNLSAVVIDAGKLAGSTGFQVSPTWSPDPAGNGPYFYPGMIGAGEIRQYSAGGNPPVYPFSLVFTAARPGNNSYATLILDADGSTVSATNPVVLADDDLIVAEWVTFVTKGWD